MKQKLHWLSLVFLLVFCSFLNGAERIDKNQSGQSDTDNVALVNNSIKITPSESQKTQVIASVIKNALETYHYRHQKIDDEFSKKSFDQFIKRIDYGKQFLIKSDIQELEKFKFSIDDEMKSGKFELLDTANTLIAKRIKLIDSFRKEFFSKDTPLKSTDKLEIDPEKRGYVATEKELLELWRKIFIHSTLTRFLTLQEEQDDSDKNKKGNKSNKGKKNVSKNDDKKKNLPPVKKLTESELITKAKDAINKKYDTYFQRTLKEDYYDKIEKLINPVASVYDPHTNYMPPKRKEDFDIDISGSLEGIGAVLQEDGSYIKVIEIVPGGAAWKQKELEVDDVILMVSEGNKEAVDLVDMRVDDAVRYIRGKKGTEVRLTVKKADGTRKVIPIVRDIVQVGESFAKSSVLEYKGVNKKFGYIHLPKFYRDFGDDQKRNCSDDVKKELEVLKKMKVDGIILDLRNNGGGALEDARRLSGLFVEKGPIVQVKNYSGEVEVLEDDDKNVIYDGPVIVLVNRFSASASEIVAGALQDYKRAIIVGGDLTHGKGTVQAVLNLNQGPLLSIFGPTIGALKVTIQKFYRITGASTQYRGIVSDIVLPDQYAYIKSREQDLDFSLPWDEIKGLPFTAWNKKLPSIEDLKAKSKKRIQDSLGMQAIVKSVEYLNKRKDETVVTLDLEAIKKDEKDSKEMLEKLKYDEIDKNLLITHHERAFLEASEFQNTKDNDWKADLERRKNDWVELLQKDAVLIESVHIINDMIDAENNKK